MTSSSRQWHWQLKVGVLWLGVGREEGEWGGGGEGGWGGGVLEVPAA
jgi:hypothetical protein